MEYRVLAYYCIVPIEDPEAEVARHQEFFRSRDFKGRIYFSYEGMNGQASGRADHAEEYRAWMALDPRFQNMAFKVHPASEHAFPKMTVKVRNQLVAIDCEVDFSDRGEHVSPQQWKEMIEKRDENTILLDVRNEYEWKIGHFEGSELPQLETFREFPSYASKLKEERDPKDTVVMMYCTGGIRCEYFSAVMKKAGFEKVYQLDGGIIHYGLEKGSEHWKGNLFVFDDRLVVPLGEERGTPIAECRHCKKECDVYYNCANMDCNELFISCSDCRSSHKGCCSKECSDQPRVRAFEESAKPFRKWEFKEKQAWKHRPLS